MGIGLAGHGRLLSQGKKFACGHCEQPRGERDGTQEHRWHLHGKPSHEALSLRIGIDLHGEGHALLRGRSMSMDISPLHSGSVSYGPLWVQRLGGLIGQGGYCEDAQFLHEAYHPR